MGALSPAALAEDAALARAEARGFWSRVWIYVGLSASLAEPGDILPFTIAEAGLHVERLADGSLAARLNRAQQGGCQVIPLQCHEGRQLRCPQAACAFSQDRLPVIDAATADRDRLLRQFIGDRPERLAAIGLRERHGLIAVRLDSDSVAEGGLPQDEPCFPGRPTEQWWQDLPAPWRIAADHLAPAGHREGWSAAFHAPNLVILEKRGWQAALILQPTAPRKTRCRIALAAPAAEAAEARLALSHCLDAAALAAGADRGDSPPGIVRLSLAELDAALRSLPGAPALRQQLGYRSNPAFGFMGG